MDWFWGILLGIVGYAIGLLAASWPTTQIGCALFCSFPLIRRLRNYGDCFNLKGCKKVFTFTIIINAVILALIIGAVVAWAPNAIAWGFWIGYGFTILLGFGQWGINENNVKDFVQLLDKFVIKEKEDEAFHALLDTIRW